MSMRRKGWILSVSETIISTAYRNIEKAAIVCIIKMRPGSSKIGHVGKYGEIFLGVLLMDYSTFQVGEVIAQFLVI